MSPDVLWMILGAFAMFGIAAITAPWTIKKIKADIAKTLADKTAVEAGVEDGEVSSYTKVMTSDDARFLLLWNRIHDLERANTDLRSAFTTQVNGLNAHITTLETAMRQGGLTVPPRALDLPA